MFVAGFIGTPAMNLFDGTIEESGVRIGTTILQANGGLPGGRGARVTVGLRPESLNLAAPGSGLPAVVTVVEELGAEAFVHARVSEPADDADASPSLIVRVASRDAPAKGAAINVTATPGEMLYFDRASGERIPA